MNLKRISTVLLVIVLLTTLLPLPVAANNYTATLPTVDGWSGAFITEGDDAGDYVFQMPVYVNTVAYAEFENGGICAAKLESNTGGVYQMRLLDSAINDNFTINTFVIDENISIFESGEGTQGNPYRIGTELELLKLMAYSTGASENESKYMQEGVYIELMSDIEFHTPIMTPLAPLKETTDPIGTAVAYAAIGNSTLDKQYFKGVFLGNGNTISGLSFDIAVNNEAIALFQGNEGTIQKLIVSTDSGSTQKAFDILKPDYSLVGCSDTCYPNYAALLVGINNGSISGCTAQGTMNATIGGAKPNNKCISVGMLAAVNKNIIENCNAAGKLTFTGIAATSACVGMICGSNLSGQYAANIIDTGSGGTGLAGSIYGCTSSGKIEVTPADKTTSSYVGGITGYCSGDSKNTTADHAVIMNCQNHATVTGTAPNKTSKKAYVGGIVGYLANPRAEVRYCWNDGTITAYSGPKAGLWLAYDFLPGLAGFLAARRKGPVEEVPHLGRGKADLPGNGAGGPDELV